MSCHSQIALCRTKGVHFQAVNPSMTFLCTCIVS